MGFDIFDCKFDGEGGKDFMFFVFGEDGLDRGFVLIFKDVFRRGIFFVKCLLRMFKFDCLKFMIVGFFMLFMLELDEDGCVVKMCFCKCKIMLFSWFGIWWILGFILVKIGGLLVMVVFLVVSLERFLVEMSDGVEFEFVFLMGFVG